MRPERSQDCHKCHVGRVSPSILLCSHFYKDIVSNLQPFLCHALIWTRLNNQNTDEAP